MHKLCLQRLALQRPRILPLRSSFSCLPIIIMWLPENQAGAAAPNRMVWLAELICQSSFASQTIQLQLTIFLILCWGVLYKNQSDQQVVERTSEASFQRLSACFIALKVTVSLKLLLEMRLDRAPCRLRSPIRLRLLRVIVLL